MRVLLTQHIRPTRSADIAARRAPLCGSKPWSRKRPRSDQAAWRAETREGLEPAFADLCPHPHPSGTDNFLPACQSLSDAGFSAILGHLLSFLLKPLAVCNEAAAPLSHKRKERIPRKWSRRPGLPANLNARPRKLCALLA